MATPFTAEDVKFSFLRYKGAKQLRDKGREVEIVDSYRIRFHLHTPWPDFMAYYGTPWRPGRRGLSRRSTSNTSGTMALKSTLLAWAPTSL